MDEKTEIGMGRCGGLIAMLENVMFVNTTVSMDGNDVLDAIEEADARRCFD